MSEPLLSVENLVTSFSSEGKVVRAVDGVSLEVYRGETLALVGESGCGKSVTALSVLRLLPSPPGRIESGTIRFSGLDLTASSERELQRLRGNRLAMIFQEPMTSLNPVFTVGAQVAESLRLHRGLSKADARVKVLELLTRVGIPAPDERIDSYPHQLSGGMRQRVMIAMALSCEPELLIADEPTTALDVTIQSQILALLEDLKQSTGMSILFITHDLGIVAEIAERVVVMYAGQVVETASVRQLFASPAHPYSAGLLASVPGRLRAAGGERPRRLPTIEGTVPNLAQLPAGCRFAERCARRRTLSAEDRERCDEQSPPLRQLDSDWQVRCLFPLSGADA